MGIDVEWVNERHEKQQHVHDSSGSFIRLVISGKGLEDTLCLRFIDPWGDTVFNQLQVKQLREELDGLLAKTTDAQLAEHLKKIIRLVGLSHDRPHTYIKFVGD